MVAARRLYAAALVALALALPGCAATTAAVPGRSVSGQPVVVDRLYFGRSIRDGSFVSDTAWATFLDRVVTPWFPDGLTAWKAEGQWREAGGAVGHESSFVLELIHAESSAATGAVEAIATEYKRRFRQDSVLWISTPARTKP